MGKIIWLASYPKSGNTWIRAFLANLFSGADQPFNINDLNLFCSSLTARVRFDEAAGRSTVDFTEYELLHLRGRVQQAFCATIPESAFMKTHSRFGDQLGLPLIDPECTAGAIYVVRNPLDVAVSAASHYGVTAEEMIRAMVDPNFKTAATDKHVTEFIGSWSANVASWTTPAHPKIHVVRYEDLSVAPEAEFARLATFLGLRATAEQLSRAIRFSSFASMAEQERWVGFKERPAHAVAFFRSGKPGDGPRALGPALIGAVTRAHGAQMARFGYL
jgi:hypothetical protein